MIKPTDSGPFGLGLLDLNEDVSEVEADLLYFLRAAPDKPLALPAMDAPAYRELLARDGFPVEEAEQESREYRTARRTLCDRLRAYLAAVEAQEEEATGAAP